MDKKDFIKIENYMLSQMKDSAHDRFHVYRVLYSALDIAATESGVDMDVLTTACLLHDVGRERQFTDPKLCHAKTGGEMAYEFLLSMKWDVNKSQHVRDCISSHRFRGDNRPQSIEAKILFDADKLDVTGALGIARTLFYSGQVSEPLYIVDENGDIVTTGSDADISSFIQEYNYKLKNLYDSFYTRRANEMAMEHQKAAADYYGSLYNEISYNLHSGKKALDTFLNI